MVIHAVQFDPNSETFVPYTQKPADIIFPDLGVYATPVKGGPGVDIDSLIGFDTTGMHPNPTNPDATIVEPGLSLGMK